MVNEFRKIYILKIWWLNIFFSSRRVRIEFVDGDKNNNYYKKLIYMDTQEICEVRYGLVSIDKYVKRQEYIKKL